MRAKLARTGDAYRSADFATSISSSSGGSAAFWRARFEPFPPGCVPNSRGPTTKLADNWLLKFSFKTEISSDNSECDSWGVLHDTKCWVPPGAVGAAHSEEDPHDANLHSPAKGAAHPMKPVSRSWRRNRRWVPHGNFREPRRIGILRTLRDGSSLEPSTQGGSDSLTGY